MKSTKNIFSVNFKKTRKLSTAHKHVHNGKYYRHFI